MLLLGLAAAPPVPARNATTRLAEGARSKPSLTPGVGKWLAGHSTHACCRSFPVAGSMPDSVPLRLIDQTRPPATMGGLLLIRDVHSTRSPGADPPALTATTPLRQGR